MITEQNFYIFLKSKYDEETYNHCIRVHEIARTNNYYITMYVALLHDILEDTDCTVKEICNSLKGLCSNSDILRIINSVEILTRSKDETYYEYINRIVKSRNIDAIKVKLFDLMDHLAQIETLTDSLEKRYIEAFKIINIAYVDYLTK